MVAHNRHKAALQELMLFFEFIELEEAEDELALIFSQLERAESSFRLETISRETYNLEINNISNRILDFLNCHFPSKSQARQNY